MSTSLRQSRKLDHINETLLLNDGPSDTRFSDFNLIHNCLPELALQDINLATHVAGINLNHPVIINAITGGTDDVVTINRQLAIVARETATAMAVGSQYGAVSTATGAMSFEIVREVNPAGIIFGNIGAHASLAQAQQAVSMLDAAALQIHLNPAQEIIMPEGDRDFSGYLERIEQAAANLSVPIIVKETGCGISMTQAARLGAAGVAAIDISGVGGTNFMAIEAKRSTLSLAQDELGWGIPTAISAAETITVLPPNIDLIVSGGIRTPLEAVKALVIGANAVAIAAPVLRLIMIDGVDAAIDWVHQFLAEIRRLLLLIGCQNPAKARLAPLVVTGFSRDWLSLRGVPLDQWAQRS